MDAPKWAQKVSDCCPHAFNRIDVDFSNTISIVISCPLPLIPFLNNYIPFATFVKYLKFVIWAIAALV